MFKSLGTSQRGRLSLLKRTYCTFVFDNVWCSSRVDSGQSPECQRQASPLAFLVFSSSINNSSTWIQRDRLHGSAANSSMVWAQRGGDWEEKQTLLHDASKKNSLQLFKSQRLEQKVLRTCGHLRLAATSLPLLNQKLSLAKSRSPHQTKINTVFPNWDECLQILRRVGNSLDCSLRL